MELGHSYYIRHLMDKSFIIGKDFLNLSPVTHKIFASIGIIEMRHEILQNISLIFNIRHSCDPLKD